MAEQERLFAKTFLSTISSQPITYADDYQQPREHSLKRVPVLQVPVPAPPTRKPHLEANSSSASISLVFKSLKPAATFTLDRVQPTDSISAIKAQLSSLPSAPPAEGQRLLLKGKVLLDAKLLKEYSIKDGDTLNIAIKPGFHWDPSAPPPPPATENAPHMLTAPVQQQQPKAFGSGSLDPHARPQRGKHGRIPSVVLSPSPSSDSLRGGPEKDILITLDADTHLRPTETTYHRTVSRPEFWQGLYDFLKKEFTTEADLNLAFENFLCASKASLTASEIAKIRDTVGVIGMAGI